MKKKIIKLNKHEVIVGIEPKVCSGPGWGNSPLWIHIFDNQTNKYRSDCIQPNERTKEMNILFPILMAANSAMSEALQDIIKQKTDA